MSSQEAVNQRDLRMRSREIMDAVERGESFTVTRDGREVAEIIPLRRRRRFVSRAEFAAAFRGAPRIDPERLRRDLDAVIDSEGLNPYAR